MKRIAKLISVLGIAGVIIIAGIIYINVSPPEDEGSNGDDDEDNGEDGITYLINIYVNSTIYSSLSSDFSDYISNIQNQGYDVNVFVWSNDAAMDATALKLNLTYYYNNSNLKGAIMVGKLPYAMARGTDTYGQMYNFPCDLYLMDLDGQWTDHSGDNVWDLDYNLPPSLFEHSNGTGDDTPEIWVARIGNFSIQSGFNYANELNNYFQRNSQFRNGDFGPRNKALLYIDDDWTSVTSEWVSNFTAYTGDKLYVYNDVPPSNTNAQGYMSNLTSTSKPNFVYYELVHVLVHSLSTEHQFGPGSNPKSQGTITWKDVKTNCTEPLFYNLYACSACNYSLPNNLGTQYLLSNSSTITVIGGARPGCMSLYQPFYDSLKNGDTFGDAFVEWFHNPDLKVQFSPPAPSHWHEVYGMTLLGDPLATIYMT